MSFLNEDFENTTTCIGVRQNGNVSWIGTGFFVIAPSKINANKYMFLVTNKHVIQGLDSIVIRAHLKDNSIGIIDAPLIKNNKPIYTCHPNEKIDIAVVQLSAQYIQMSLNKIKAFDIDEQAYTAQDYLSSGGFEGSPVFMLGFPMKMIDDYSTTPICRSGCVARFKLDDIKHSYNFLLDIQNFPGNSGSPIISCPECVGLEGTKILTKSVLLGIVHRCINYKETLINTQTQEIVEIRSENSGLALAHPVDFIKEVIELDLKNKNI